MALAGATQGRSDDLQSAAGQAPEVMLRMISPLARGADWLAARAALDAGYELYVPMPLEQAEFERL